MRTTSTSSLVCLALAACLPPATIVTPQEAPAPPAVFQEQVEGVDEAALVPLGERITPGACPSDLADMREPYFDGRVLLRLPKGVTADNFAEMTPMFARLFGPVESTNCIAGMPGAMIEFMALVAFEDDPSKSLETTRDELLEAIGYGPEIVLVEQDVLASDRAGMWVYGVPPSLDKPDPAKALVTLRSDGELFAAIVYEVHPNAWSVMVNTIVESAGGMLLVEP